MKFPLNLPFLRRARATAAPRLTVQKHVPLWLRALGVLATVMVGGGIAIMGWQATIGKGALHRDTLLSEIQGLKEQLNGAVADSKKLQTLVDTAESRIKIEQTAQQDLARQLAALEADNAKLKVDLAYMESLLPAAASSGGAISIRRFVVDKDRAPNQWQMKALLVQADKAEREFSGTLQVVVTGVQAGKNATWTWPEATKAEAKGETPSKSKISFKRTLRLNETIVTPVDLQVKTMQLRVLEAGSVRVAQTVNP